MAVHRYFGCGFTEKVYQDALEQEFLSLGIQFRREPSLHIKYREVQLGAEFIPDFICYDKVIVELKAVRELDDMHRSQAINYAKVVMKQLTGNNPAQEESSTTVYLLVEELNKFI